MYKKCCKILIILSLFGFALVSPNIHAANIKDQELNSNIVLAQDTQVQITDKTMKNTASSQLAFWGLGAALIGFIAMSQRRGI